MFAKTLVAVIRGEEDLPRVLDVAGAVALKNEGFIIGVHSEPSPAAYVPAIGMEGIPYDASILEANRERMDALGVAFKAYLSRQGLAGEWRGIESFSGDSALSSISSAFSADLVVVQQDDPDHPESGELNLGALLFESGRPVLMVPYTWSSQFDPKRIIIAWNNTREAARAAFDALPFLARAQEVEILLIDPESNEEHRASMQGSELALALDRHGIRAQIVNQPSGGIPIGEAIENRITESAADMVVMGAYSKSRLRELLFGGATRTLLSSMPVPVLLSR
ncbi:MAG: universal stress protein [Rhizobiaceae bacterium]